MAKTGSQADDPLRVSMTQNVSQPLLHILGAAMGKLIKLLLNL